MPPAKQRTSQGFYDEPLAKPPGQSTPPATPPAATPASESKLLDDVIMATAQKLDRIATQHTLTGPNAPQTLMVRSLVVARGIQLLREAMTPEVMKNLMALMDTPLGFMTDRSRSDKGPYSPEIVRDCIIEGLLKGFYPVGNEMNIIAGRFYGAQQGWYRKLREVPGISNIEASPGVPVRTANGVAVRVAIRWAIDGRPDQLRDGDNKPGRVFPIIIYEKGYTADQAIGKGLAKAYRAAYFQATGSPNLGLMMELEDPAERPSDPSEVPNQSADAPPFVPNQAAEGPTEEQLHQQA
jgi:hypothetical protein